MAFVTKSNSTEGTTVGEISGLECVPNSLLGLKYSFKSYSINLLLKINNLFRKNFCILSRKEPFLISLVGLFTIFRPVSVEISWVERWVTLPNTDFLKGKQ